MWKKAKGQNKCSILGLLLFNIFICDLSLFTNDIDIANYAVDITSHAASSKINLAIEKLEQSSDSLFTWFQNNGMKPNVDNFLVSTKVCRINNVVNINKFKIKINEINIESSPQEKLIGVILDNQINFKSHMSNLCKTASQILKTLARVSSFMDLPKRRLVMKAYINSQFGYCPLVWMMHSRSISSKINRVHERALRIVYKDKFSSFENLLEKDKAVKIHVRNLQVLVTEMFKVKNGIASKIIIDIFKLSNPTYIT